MKRSGIRITAATVLAFAMTSTAGAASFFHAGKTVSLDGSALLSNPLDDFLFEMNYNGFGSSAQVPIPGLTSKILFNYRGTSGSTYNFSYTLLNTSGGDIDLSRVTIFGFNTDPTIAGVATGPNDQFNIVAAGNQPNGMAAIELCFKDKGPTGNCTGASLGVSKGGAATGSFALTFSPMVGRIVMSDFTVRYQGIYADGPSLYYNDGSASGVGNPVPEPATWALMIAGFGMVGAALRRRRLPHPLAA